jgi:hypothetical protein
MEFKSQICTTKEQSERLLKLGLKSETSDCTWFKRDDHTQWEWCTTSYTEWIEKILPIVNVYALRDIIPAWSLHRLIEIIDYPSNIDTIKELLTAKTMFNNRLYDRVISIIEYLISNNNFNKDYLENEIK